MDYKVNDIVVNAYGKKYALSSHYPDMECFVGKTWPDLDIWGYITYDQLYKDYTLTEEKYCDHSWKEIDLIISKCYNCIVCGAKK